MKKKFLLPYPFKQKQRQIVKENPVNLKRMRSAISSYTTRDRRITVKYENPTQTAPITLVSDTLVSVCLSKLQSSEREYCFAVPVAVAVAFV